MHQGPGEELATYGSRRGELPKLGRSSTLHTQQTIQPGQRGSPLLSFVKGLERHILGFELYSFGENFK